MGVKEVILVNDDGTLQHYAPAAASPSVPPIVAPPVVRRMQVGVNLDENNFNGDGGMFVDAALTFDVPLKLNANGSATKDAAGKNVVAKTGPGGFPAEDCFIWAWMWAYPKETYELLWTGGGPGVKAEARGKGKVLSQSGGQSQPGGATFYRATVDFDPSRGSIFELRFTGVTEAIRFLSMRPQGDSGNTFRDEFLARLNPFAAIRFMDFTSTNGSPVARWSDRTLLTDYQQAVPTGWGMGRKKGTAWEYAVALARQTQKPAWINVPHLYDDDAVTQLAKLWKGLPVIVEFSNEVWNTQFPQYAAEFANAQTNPDLTASDPNERAYQQLAWRVRHVGDIFRGIYGDESDKVKVVYATHLNNSQWAKSGLDYLAKKYGPPANYVWAGAVTGYMHPWNGPGDPTPKNADEWFAALKLATDKPRDAAVRHRDLFGQCNLPVAVYEGHEIIDGPEKTFLDSIPLDPRAYQGELDSLSAAERDLDAPLFMIFNFSGKWGPKGRWGLMDKLQNADQSPRYKAAVDFIGGKR